MAKSNPVDETRIADPVERTKRQRRSNAKKAARNSEGAETATPQEECRRQSQRYQTCKRQTEQTADMPRPARSPGRCND